MKRMEALGKTRHGNASEDRIAKRFGAQKTPASGALRGAKGDMRLKAGPRKMLVEAKSTVNDSLSLQLAWLVKIATEGRAIGSVPVLSVSFVTADGSARQNGDWVMIPRADYEELLEDLRGKEG
ncbi:hypothetical protein [Burkholderia ubonensis]|uniref:hypothetical protein n=1 Tax=Burkholderia ubonensis TaxID=101571 RepID=UPI0012FBF7F0|nr:hypothetical protein [Burkholderia ubonensis]